MKERPKVFELLEREREREIKRRIIIVTGGMGEREMIILLSVNNKETKVITTWIGMVGARERN